MVITCFVVLPLFMIVGYMDHLEKEEPVIENHDLLADISFTSREDIHRVKPISVTYLPDVYVAYLPTECAKDPRIVYQYAQEVLINGKPYASGDSIADLKTGEFLDFEIRGAEEVRNARFVLYGSDNIPSLYIDTITGTMESVDTSRFHVYAETAKYYAVDTDGLLIASGNCTIKGRGNTTWDYSDMTEKKPYNIELENEKSLYGMGAQKKWSLLANFFDGSALRSWLAYDVAQKLDMPAAVETRFVNVILNGKYNGLYLMTQHIDVTGGNVKISDLGKENKKLNGGGISALIQDQDADGRVYSYYEGKSPPNVTGGYLMEFSANTEGMKEMQTMAGPWFEMEHNNIIIESPKYPTKEEVEYLRQYMMEVESAIFDKTDDSYRQYLDMDSWLNMYFMREFFAGWDGENNSSYLYKDRDSNVLVNGPAWDYDLSMGQVWLSHAPFTTNCMWLESKTEFSWLQGLKNGHKDFADELVERYYDVFLPIVTKAITEDLPAQYEYICQAAQMDYVRFPAASRKHYTGNFEEEYAYLQQWLQERTEFFTDYMQNPEKYIQYEIQGRNRFICYALPGTTITELPVDDGKECNWFYANGKQVQVGDEIKAGMKMFSASVWKDRLKK